MRNKFAETVYELAKRDPKVVVIVADISPAGAMDKLRKDFPERFINTGVAEQIMIGMAAGMALKGFKVFCYTIATFALYRAFEFVRDDLAYQNLPVTVVGIGGGVTYSTLGGTHHAMEDIAIALAVPNLKVIAPCDPFETEQATQWCYQNKHGPVYLRLGKAGEPTSPSQEFWVPGKVRAVRSGSGRTAILTYGPTGLKLALAVADRLEGPESVHAPSVYSVHTLKPLDQAAIARILLRHERVIVIEEMIASAGLGMMVRVIAQSEGITTDIRNYGLAREFMHVYGSHDDVLAAHGLTVESIVADLKSWARR